MSETSPRLGLPYIAEAQAQKHVTHNEAVAALDALVQATVKDRDLTAPPAAPTEGDCYIVAAAATGDWAGHDGELAVRDAGAWRFHAPAPGWRVWSEDEDLLLVLGADGWRPMTAGAVDGGTY